VSCLIRLLKKNSLMKCMPQKYSSRSCSPLIIAMPRILLTEIWNLRISCIPLKMMLLTLRSLILDCRRFVTNTTLAKSRNLRRELELLTIFLQKSSLEIMTNRAIYGLLAAYFTSYCVDTLLSTGMMIKKYWEVCKKENMTLTEKSGMIYQKKQKI